MRQIQVFQDRGHRGGFSDQGNHARNIFLALVPTVSSSTGEKLFEFLWR